MSRRSTTGFSLLEVQVGLLLLTLVVVGFTRLVGAQESLVRDLESWCQGDPVFRVVPPADEHERVARVPAALDQLVEDDGLIEWQGGSDGEGGSGSEAESWGNDLEIQEVTRDLDPQRARAVLDVTPIRREDEDEEDEEDEEEDDEEEEDEEEEDDD
ncbi:MAG: hypothetical protein QNJ90_12670 [Planctomycetota bacterium]|nr:hypothetical protein [Planctomycetota bacterium]